MFLLGVVLVGCLPWKALFAEAGHSVGTVSRGYLNAPEQLPLRGDNFRIYRKGDRRFGTPELVGMIHRVADRVADAHPGSVLLVGDLSGSRGGFISERRSHRSGRDVDLAYFLSDPKGRRIAGVPLVRLDLLGVGLRGKRPIRFDAKRNWAVVDALLTDPQAEVQWIFVSRGLKALLLKWSLTHGRDVSLIQRAAEVLHQPSDSASHDDHFHVRIYCPRGAAGYLCQDLGPVWPWISDRDKSQAISGYTDEELVRLATEGL